MRKNGTPIRAIRQYCLDCSSGPKAVKFCPDTACPLWPLRFGMRRKTAAKKFGPELLTPELMPDPNISLEDLPDTAPTVAKSRAASRDTARHSVSVETAG